MRTVEGFKDYELIDADSGERLERWGDIILIRPDPQVIWSGKRQDKRWYSANAIYHRSQSGGGYWERLSNVPDVWSIKYDDLTFRLKPMGFKHTGLFPEQAVNWRLAKDLIEKENREIKVLNLFAYTGGATVACLSAGASVTHVDASKGMVQWAKENAVASGLEGGNVRWLVDDCLKFVKREIRRGNKYDGIIMDPPSYGRGPTGEVWKIEESIDDFVKLTASVLSDKPLFFLLNSYTTGLSASTMKYIASVRLLSGRRGRIEADELGLPVKNSGLSLPCGSSVRVTFE